MTFSLCEYNAALCSSSAIFALLLSISCSSSYVLFPLCVIGPAEGEEESFTHQLRGVIPRAFEYLFSLINREQEKVLQDCCVMSLIGTFKKSSFSCYGH